MLHFTRTQFSNRLCVVDLEKAWMGGIPMIVGVVSLCILLPSALAEDADEVLRVIQRREWTRLKDFQHVTEVDMASVLISNKEFPKVAVLKNIKSLSLNGSTFGNDLDEIITDDGLPYLGMFPKVEKLRLDGHGFTADGVKFLIALPKLHELDIVLTQMGLRGEAGLAELKNLVSLRAGDLCPQALKDVSKLPRLEKLEFYGDFLTDEDLLPLAKCSSLQELTLTKFWTPGPAIEYVKSIERTLPEEKLLFSTVRLIRELARQSENESSGAFDSQWIAIAQHYPRLSPQAGHPGIDVVELRRSIRELQEFLGNLSGTAASQLPPLSRNTRQLARLVFRKNDARLAEIESEIDRAIGVKSSVVKDSAPKVLTPLGKTRLAIVFPDNPGILASENIDEVVLASGEGKNVIRVEISKIEGTPERAEALLGLISTMEASVYEGRVLDVKQFRYLKKFPACDSKMIVKDIQDGLPYRMQRIVLADGYQITLKYLSPIAIQEEAGRAFFDSLVEVQ